MTQIPSSEIFRQKIAKLTTATDLVKSYQHNIDHILENDQVDETLATLAPYLDVMNSMASDLEGMTPDTKEQLQQTILDFRQSLDDLLAAIVRVKEETIAQTQTLKSHNKSATAYIKAANGAGY